ncbi:signal peptidase I [Anaerocolumna cellulosilytica]|uniref:Signal peptidase I n=1 Tax=Anaerocolumna cellulosilytica TaxID=433286 RepID=A0A6S6R1M3_9FIRM|nr:signal peptidase I [Anaerocolumna cellulosilytica]MBB5197637.1 signal peptidase I [Anaerocolumna cellulosilytica]BCJ93210.1 signal peptidase I [Anaerocolumna cellulosilytica]
MKYKILLKTALNWVGMAAFVFILSMFLQSEVFASPTVDQSSMENTLYPKQRMIVDKLSYNFTEPDRGDIVIFLRNGEKGSIVDEMLRNMELFTNRFVKNEEIEIKHEMLVKRAIGVAGDVVDIKDGLVYINGEALDEPYAKGVTFPGKVSMPITVGEDQLFVLGDNREVSIDSRDFGLVDYDQLEGKAVFRIAPLNKIGILK